MPRKYTDELLREAAQHSHSIAEVLRYLGLRQAGGTHALISRRLKEYGITFPATKAWAKGKPSSRRKSASEIFIVLPDGSRRPGLTQLRRALKDVGEPEVCKQCGLEPFWQNKKLVLSIDHIDGNWLNNTRNNLRYLCPNCHSQTSTYCRTTG